MKILKSLDPLYVLHRMGTDQIVGVLADRSLNDLAGQELMLADGAVAVGAEPLAYGVVKIRKGVQFESGEAAVSKLGEKLDPFMAAHFEESAAPVWFHSLEPVDVWKTALVAKGLEVQHTVKKSVSPEDQALALEEMDQPELDAVARMLDSQQDLDGAYELAVLVKSEYGRRGQDPDEELQIFKSVWSTAYKNDLPDSAFLYIAPGGKKDDEDKTVPRTLRNFPVYDADGKLDIVHVRDAIGRIPQSKAPGLTAEKMAALQDKARKLLEEAKKKA